MEEPDSDKKEPPQVKVDIDDDLSFVVYAKEDGNKLSIRQNVGLIRTLLIKALLALS